MRSLPAQPIPPEGLTMRSLPRREFFADTAKLAAAMAAIPGVNAVAAADDGEANTKPAGPTIRCGSRFAA